METVTKYKTKSFIVAALLAVLFLGCTKYTDLGMDLLPSTDLLSVKNTIIKDDISAFTFREDSIRTDKGRKSLLGSMNDPIFGNTTVDFATQFRITSYPDYGTNPEVDSVKLYFYYKSVYGDTITPQHVRVYELNEPLYSDLSDSTGSSANNPYYQDVDLKSMASSQIIGELEFTPRFRMDSTSTDTLYQALIVPLDQSIGEKLLNADSLDMINNEVFLDYFKGLYIESERLGSGDGAILALDAAANSSFQGSALVVFYDNDENDEVGDTLSMPYIITSNSARVNRITQDYSETVFESKLNSTSNPDSLIYIQTMGGLESKIEIDNLSNWSDSTNVAINKAELIFQVDTILSDPENYLLPEQLLFTFIDSDGSQYLPQDYSFSPGFYGGVLYSDYTYRFNITQHLQQIIEGVVENNGFYLTTAEKNSAAKRVVLKGSTSNAGIKLIITYSKFLQ